MHQTANAPETVFLLLTCWLSSVRVRRVLITSSALAASIRPPPKAETPTHATEYAKTCTGGHIQIKQSSFKYYSI